jgi:hypothetical protein
VALALGQICSLSGLRPIIIFLILPIHARLRAGSLRCRQAMARAIKHQTMTKTVYPRTWDARGIFCLMCHLQKNQPHELWEKESLFKSPRGLHRQLQPPSECALPSARSIRVTLAGAGILPSQDVNRRLTMKCLRGSTLPIVGLYQTNSARIRNAENDPERPSPRLI